MSERERWIIYPLLFFALGAALRDKLLQRIESKEICCESLKIVDPQDSMRILAELGSGKEISYNPSQTAGRVGVLTIQDSDGKEACQLANMDPIRTISPTWHNFMKKDNFTIRFADCDIIISHTRKQISQLS